MHFPFMVFYKHITFHMVSHQQFTLSEGAKWKQIIEKEHRLCVTFLYIWTLVKKMDIKVTVTFTWTFHGCI